MKRIFNYVFYAFTVSFLVFLMTTMNSPSLLVVPYNSVYATPQQEDESSSENNDSSPDANEGPDTTQENGVSEQSEGNNNEENSNVDSSDSSPSDQSNTCPNTDTNDFANVPTYIGQDGCMYPCPSSEDQSSIPQGCPVESPQQATSGFSINEERPIQSQQPLQTTTNESRQNVQSNPSPSTFASPRINSDTTITTTSNIPTTEPTTTTQKSFNPAGQFKPGSGQTELNIPRMSDNVARPLTPGGGNAEVEGIPAQPNTNPQTPIDPGNIPTTIPDRAYLTVITKMIGFYTGYLKVSDFEICVKSTIQSNGNFRDVDAIPRCANGSASGFKYTVQAPGSVIIWVNNLDTLGSKSLMIETPNLNSHISASESKTSTVYISPYLQQ